MSNKEAYNLFKKAERNRNIGTALFLGGGVALSIINEKIAYAIQDIMDYGFQYFRHQPLEATLAFLIPALMGYGLSRIITSWDIIYGDEKVMLMAALDRYEKLLKYRQRGERKVMNSILED